MPKKPLKICLICSVGGHFKQMLKIMPALESYEHFFVLFKKPILERFASQKNVYYVVSPERNIFLFIVNFFQSFMLFMKTKPDVVVSTGAGVVIALCYIAKLCGRKIIHIEDWCVIAKPSLTGKLLYPISDLFIIQREQLRTFYPRAVCGGELF